ncbi:MmcQ/YjbR family DNA-binding protein [Nocardioides panacisoli]|uniref:MmcQ/YjbR family DNA-binding protein n=1 Tax=Nocardioides panacisoli TaxID=627624 RepID=A0ABP7HWH3_9ACTN
MADRPDVPLAWVERLREIVARFPECEEYAAWTGVAWRVRQATVAHVFGGEDQLFRIRFFAEPDEVLAFEHLGAPYYRSDWGVNAVGILLDDGTDWEELAELLTDSYCLQAPRSLAEQVPRPAQA